jgi:8-oxo-dGTP pyrophosphatase MutT (NUDIX family)
VATRRGRLPTVEQVSAGGVAFRAAGSGIDVALICVGDRRRWQLPKGIVDPGESPEVAAVREVREEAGIEVELLAPIDTIDYWYIGTNRGSRVRFHKLVHCFLLRYLSGDVRDHDHEVHEARWVPIAEATGVLAFPTERKVVERAMAMVETARAVAP